MDHEPEFVRQGLMFARPESDRPRPAGREREEVIMAFVAAWEALHLPGAITDRREVAEIARWSELEFQTAFLARLASF